MKPAYRGMLTNGVRMEYVRCNLCDADDTEQVFAGPDRMVLGTETFNVVRCRHCGLVYVNPRPDPRKIGRHYPADYLPFMRPRSRIARMMTKAVRALDARSLREVLGRRAKVLEVGCADGEFLAYLRDRYSWEVTGLDTDIDSVTRARCNFQLDAISGSIFDAKLPSESLDGVILKHTIEHLHSPRETLDEIHRILRPGGKLFLWLPNLDSWEARVFGKHWSGYEVPRHLYTFSASSILAMLRRCHFTVRRLHFSSIPNDWINSLRFLAGGWRAPMLIQRTLVIHNPLLIALFAAPSYLCSILKRSGRIKVLAEKER